ncbi:MAG: hypothetical protein K0U64_11520 [Actinomycetia bacterium]|nr:hypothetical protein [Actinomycetes bacterium]
MHDESDAPDDEIAEYIAQAQETLAAAREAENVGDIAIAQAQLGATYADCDLHEDAVAEFNRLLDYLAIADNDGAQESQRWLRITSLSAPPPTASDVSLPRLALEVRLLQIESLLVLGRRDEARAGLQVTAPMCRGFGKRHYKKRWQELQQRLDNPELRPTTSSGRWAPPADETATPESNLSVPERLAAADEALDTGDPTVAARAALQIVSDCEHQPHYRAQARQVLGMALEKMGNVDDSRKVMQSALGDYLLAEKYPDGARLALPLALRLSAAGDNAAAAATLQQALGAPEGALPIQTRARLTTDLGSLLDQGGSSAEARRNFEAVERMRPDQETGADAHHGLAVCLANDPNADNAEKVEALSLLSQAKTAYTALGYPDRAAGCEHEAAALLGRLGSTDAARTRYEAALAAYEALTAADRTHINWDEEVRDVRENLQGLTGTPAGQSGMFRSGGHTMSHVPEGPT